MFANSYVGVVPNEIPRLIVSRARRYGIRANEIDDLQQQIVPVLAEFHYDPARANGATPTTAMTGVIDRQIKAYLRTKRRYQQRVERLQAMTPKPPGKCPATPGELTPLKPVDLRIDLEQTISRFCPRDREICRGLSDGLSTTALAKRAGCGRDTVCRSIARIRSGFEAAGLRAWIDPNGDSDAQAEQGRAQ